MLDGDDRATFACAFRDTSVPKFSATPLNARAFRCESLANEDRFPCFSTAFFNVGRFCGARHQLSRTCTPGAPASISKWWSAGRCSRHRGLILRALEGHLPCVSKQMYCSPAPQICGGAVATCSILVEMSERGIGLARLTKVPTYRMNSCEIRSYCCDSA